MNVIESCEYLGIDIMCKIHKIILEKSPRTTESIIEITNAFSCPGEKRCEELCKKMGVTFECKK